VQTLELELKMTKINSERDTEQLVDQHKALEEDKLALKSDNARLEENLASVRQEYSDLEARDINLSDQVNEI